MSVSKKYRQRMQRPLGKKEEGNVLVLSACAWNMDPKVKRLLIIMPAAVCMFPVKECLVLSCRQLSKLFCVLFELFIGQFSKTEGLMYLWTIFLVKVNVSVMKIDDDCRFPYIRDNMLYLVTVIRFREDLMYQLFVDSCDVLLAEENEKEV